MSKVIDFDAFRAERKEEPVRLRIGGKMYDLPASLPAGLAMDVIRLQEKDGAKAEVEADDLMKIGAGLFGGADQFQTVLNDARVTLTELPDLIKMVLDAYTEATAPNPMSPAE